MEAWMDWPSGMLLGHLVRRIWEDEPRAAASSVLLGSFLGACAGKSWLLKCLKPVSLDHCLLL